MNLTLSVPLLTYCYMLSSWVKKKCLTSHWFKQDNRHYSFDLIQMMQVIFKRIVSSHRWLNWWGIKDHHKEEESPRQISIWRRHRFMILPLCPQCPECCLRWEVVSSLQLRPFSYPKGYSWELGEPSNQGCGFSRRGRQDEAENLMHRKGSCTELPSISNDFNFNLGK